jgi:hypothetical protein
LAVFEPRPEIPLRLIISAAFLVVAQSDQPSYDPPDLDAVGEALGPASGLYGDWRIVVSGDIHNAVAGR